MHHIAIDWSGAKDQGVQRKNIWLAEARDGKLVRLESGRTREQVTDHVVKQSRENPSLIVGLDFAFSFPAQFFEQKKIQSADAMWELVSNEGELWLSRCEQPFWGRPGRRCPEDCVLFRRSEREMEAVGGIKPKSVFQVGGAGAVGTGSLRGMPHLLILRNAGFSIWPFHSSQLPSVIEIYPRVLTGPIRKSDRHSREEYIRTKFPQLQDALCAKAISCEDAFDAAVSVLAMARELKSAECLAFEENPETRLEGQIWNPRSPGPTSSPTIDA